MHPPQTKPDPTRHVNLDDIRKQIDQAKEQFITQMREKSSGKDKK